MVTGLSPGTMYMVRVAGINIRGLGNYSSFATGQTYRGNYIYLLLQIKQVTTELIQYLTLHLEVQS